MRDGVLEGTGRVLRSHPLRIAGKTGTAEVAGEASHSWFVGFAPYDAPAASRRIAFAVIVENAGYGGSRGGARRRRHRDRRRCGRVDQIAYVVAGLETRLEYVAVEPRVLRPASVGSRGS